MRKQLTLPLWTDPAAVPEGLMHSENSLTVEKYADRWFETHCAPPFRAHYVRRTRIASLRLYVLPYIGKVPLTGVTTALLSDMQRCLFAKGLALSTVRTAVGHFAELWKGARADGLVSGKPHSDLVWPRMRKPKPSVFTPAEREQVVRLAFERRLWFAPQVGLMFHAGLRPSEAAGVRFHDLQADIGRLEIQQAIVGHERTAGKTKRSLRNIIIPRQLVALIGELQRVQGRSHGYMSANRNGSPVHTAVFGAVWKPLLAEAGVRYRVPYAMRHTNITIMLMDGKPAPMVAQYHATSIAEIERSYLSWIGAVDPDAPKMGPAVAGRGAYRREAHPRRLIHDYQR